LRPDCGPSEKANEADSNQSFHLKTPLRFH
jgi:hypothetical protein